MFFYRGYHVFLTYLYISFNHFFWYNFLSKKNLEEFSNQTFELSALKHTFWGEKNYENRMGIKLHL